MDELELMRQRALAAVKEERWTDAEKIYRSLLLRAEQTIKEIEPNDPTNLGALLRKLGRPNEAIEHYQQWLGRFEGHKQLRLNAINCAIELNQFDLATNWIKAGLAIHSNQPELHLAQARVWQGQGQLAKARRQLEQLLQAETQLLGAWLELALVCQRLGDLRAALQANERATALDPGSAAGWGNQITLLKELGELERAGALLNQLDRSIRQQHEVRRAAANLWMEQQLMAEAEAELSELCQLQPQEAGHWLNRAACLRHLKHFVAGASVLKQGLVWAPNDKQLQESLGHCLAEIGQAQRGTDLLRRCLPKDEELSDASHAALQFVGAGYRTVSPEERRHLAQAWERRKRKEGVGPLWADKIREPLEGRRLRVGYLSADLCRHPVGRFLLTVLQEHDREAIELWGLNCGPHKDNTTEALRSCCDHWMELRFGGDLDTARRIADENLDVLVELGGYTGFSRIGTLVHKPVPVQLSYLGYFAPTYLQAIDGWVGDDVLFGHMSPIDRVAHQQVMIKGGYMAYSEADLPPVRRVTDQRFRFGSFNHSRKLSAGAVQLFCAVMAAAPKALLVLKSVSFIEEAEQKRIRKVFKQAGLEPDRIIILPWVEGRIGHLNSYAEIDVALDPLPYGGATTTCEALLMGVPVVTIAGQGMVERLSASILSSAGLSNYIATSAERYIRIAQELADQGPRLTKQRQDLRKTTQESDLGNGRRLARELEHHYLTLATAAVQESR